MSGAATRLSRIPLRRRLVAGFSATMLVLLAAAGAFVYWRVRFALDRSLDGDLRGAAAVLVPRVTESGRLPPDTDSLTRIDGFQVLDGLGQVIGNDARLGASPALVPGAVRNALEGPVFLDVGAPPRLRQAASAVRRPGVRCGSGPGRGVAQRPARRGAARAVGPAPRRRPRGGRRGISGRRPARPSRASTSGVLPGQSRRHRVGGDRPPPGRARGPRRRDHPPRTHPEPDAGLARRRDRTGSGASSTTPATSSALR